MRGCWSPLLPYIVLPTIAAIVIGVWWKPRDWWKLALIFFGIFVLFFTTILTTVGGLFDGLVRYLGYWMVQHGESRGSQPWFYYLFVQIPIYEYLPAIGAVIAFFIALRRRLWAAAPGAPFQPAVRADEDRQPVPAISLFLFWALFSLVIFSYAGEKMPQQTMLISAPMILAAAWAVGYLLDTKSLGEVFRIRQWKFEIPAGVTHGLRNAVLAAFVVLGLLTARTAYFATYINYDYPNEYMAYAHGAPGPKIVLKEIERLSYLTTGGKDIVVAYDNFVRYPYWWYLRDYPEQDRFRRQPRDGNPQRGDRRGRRAEQQQGPPDPRGGLRQLHADADVVAQPGLFHPEMGFHRQRVHRRCAGKGSGESAADVERRLPAPVLGPRGADLHRPRHPLGRVPDLAQPRFRPVGHADELDRLHL